MALNWNIEKCKDYKSLTTDKEYPITDSLIWGTLMVGIGDITEKNFKEFYARFNLMQRLTGAFLTRNGKPYYITLEDIQRRIGLSTNVSDVTRNAFIKQKVGRYFEETVA
jgi:hypothetical protein